MRNALACLIATAALSALALNAAQGQSLADIACESPPIAHCTENCAAAPGTVVEPQSGRSFIVDYPCNLQPGDKVTVILNLHGAGSTGASQRNYFPLNDYKDDYRLFILTPTAGSENHIWSSQADDAFLGRITDWAFAQLGAQRVKGLWLAGHSQGGITATRLVCSDYFRNRVSGLLSLSGGRIGRIQYADGFFPANRSPAPASAAAAPVDEAAAFDCDFSYIYGSGENEIVSLPDTSPLASKYHCAARIQNADVVDTEGGYVAGGDRDGVSNPAWSVGALPGTARIFTYPQCEQGRLVADVWRLNKGHTDGLEPKVTEAIAAMMAGMR